MYAVTNFLITIASAHVVTYILNQYNANAMK